VTGGSIRTRFVLIRHGELRRIEPAAIIYGSPLARAAQSAQLVASVSHDVRLDERLCELDFGDFEGLTYDDIAAKWPRIYRDWMQRPAHVTCPNGESVAAMRYRVRKAFQQFRQRHGGQTIAVVSHAGVHRIALGSALRLRLADTFRLHQDHAHVSVMDYLGDEPLVQIVNADVCAAC
jgi:broad specificity phosphatase PhoE